MKLAAISDIHGNLAALEAVLDDISIRGIGVVVNLGDIASGPLYPRETVDRLMPLGLPTIKGNHERQLLTLAPDHMGQSDRSAAELLREDQLCWMTSLPSSLLLWDEVLLVHGTPVSDVEYFLETVTEDGLRPATAAEVAQRAAGVHSEIILCGHTHLPKVLQVEGGPLIVNPGSVGLPAYEDDRPHPHRVESGTPQAQYAVLERKPDGWRTELVAVDYDWTLAARYAADHNRPDWANALATGYVSLSPFARILEVRFRAETRGGLDGEFVEWIAPALSTPKLPELHDTCSAGNTDAVPHVRRDLCA